MTDFRCLERHGLRLAIHNSGGAGVPVIFQHGLCGEQSQTSTIMPKDGSYARWTLDCRGHGFSEAGDPEAFSIANFADDVLAMAQEAGLKKFVVGGISMGAAIALRIAVLHPEKILGLVLARPAWVCEKAPDNMRPNLMAGELLSANEPEAARAEFLASQMAGELQDNAPDNLTSLLAMFNREPIEVTSQLLIRISNDGPGVSEEDLQNISVPTLVLGTGDDFVHPLSFVDRLVSMIPLARRAEITSKSKSMDAYTLEFQTSMSDFLKEFS